MAWKVVEEFIVLRGNEAVHYQKTDQVIDLADEEIAELLAARKIEPVEAPDADFSELFAPAIGEWLDAEKQYAVDVDSWLATEKQHTADVKAWLAAEKDHGDEVEKKRAARTSR